MATMSAGGTPVASREPSEAAEVGESLRARDCLVQRGAALNTEYPVGVLELGAGESEFCAVIAITEIQGKLLVGVPEAVWNRSLSKRRLPVKALSKAALCAVVGCKIGQRQEETDIVVRTKVWIGLLDPTLEDHLDFGDFGADPTYHFGTADSDLAVPYAPALIEVANEHFEFMTAESERMEDPAVESRLQKMEEMLVALQSSIAAMTGGGPGKAATLPQRPAKVITANPKAVPMPNGAVPQPRYRGLDSGTVQAALAAGVPSNHLEEMSKILQNRPGRLEDVPRKAKGSTAKGPLDESEEEGEGEAELIPADDGLPEAGAPKAMQEAILKLTNIAAKLSGGEGKKDKIEELLDGGGSGSVLGSESHSAPSSRKNSAALRALQRCLREDPKFLYQTVEANLQSDFLGRASYAGEPLVAGTTVRGWLASRSRIQNYQNHVRWCWIVGGIWDALIHNRAEEARARCALAVSAADQASIDGGNWMMSTVALLEPLPPYQQFSNHTAPTLAEAQHSALYDARWTEIFMTHLKEVDAFAEARKKLSGKANVIKGDREEDPARVRPNPKNKAKAERAERAKAARLAASSTAESGGGQ